MEPTAATIAHTLHQQHITHHDVATFLEIEPAEAADLIAGHHPWPMDLLYRLATHVGITPEQLFPN